MSYHILKLIYSFAAGAFFFFILSDCLITIIEGCHTNVPHPSIKIKY